MKKVLTLALLTTAGFILAGCTLFGPKENEGTVVVETNATTTGEAKQECLGMGYQWNDAMAQCERVDEMTACLQSNNQWDEKTDTCEYSKDNCLASNHQWNEQDASCEYKKEECLAMNAQWDEQKSKCEILPMTIEQKMANCLEDDGQWDHTNKTCQEDDDVSDDDNKSDDDAKDDDKDSDESTSSTDGSDRAKNYTLADVKLHATEQSCWAAVDGKVYDLTNWIGKHPGGPDKIKAICGMDATATFNGQHDGQEKPENTLSSFMIGELAQ